MTGGTRNFVMGPGGMGGPEGLKTRKNAKITRDVHSSGAPWVPLEGPLLASKGPKGWLVSPLKILSGPYILFKGPVKPPGDIMGLKKAPWRAPFKIMGGPFWASMSL